MNKKTETLLYYEKNAESFTDNTATVDMKDIQSRFLKELPEGAYILDLGCGSGRDTKAFLEKGYHVDASDGSEELCKKASSLTGIPVKCMLFQELEAVDVYDGIWACASILHLPKKDLADVLCKIAAALKKNGVLYTSFKYGSFEGMRNGRYFTDFTENSLREFWKKVRWNGGVAGNQSDEPCDGWAARGQDDGQGSEAAGITGSGAAGGHWNGGMLESGAVPEIVVLIGPEGDFSPEEVREAIAAGFVPVSLGESRLRTETAAVTAAEAVYLSLL